MKIRVNKRLAAVFFLFFPHSGMGVQNGINSNLSATRPPNQSQWVRGPFTPSALMYNSVGAQRTGGSGYGFVPSNEADNIPRMKLRGLLNPKADQFIALLEVQGVGVFMVREGDEFNIDPSQQKNAIRISKITRLSVTVETGRLGAIRVLR